ncbi:hypothetical protein F4703DRAFT_1854189 [Phycomyces blakesleeanus]
MALTTGKSKGKPNCEPLSLSPRGSKTDSVQLSGRGVKVLPAKKKENTIMSTRQYPWNINASKSCLTRSVSRPLLSQSPSLSALSLGTSYTSTLISASTSTPSKNEAESRQSIPISGEDIAAHQTFEKIGTMSKVEKSQSLKQHEYEYKYEAQDEDDGNEDDNEDEDEDYVLVHEISFTHQPPVAQDKHPQTPEEEEEDLYQVDSCGDNSTKISLENRENATRSSPFPLLPPITSFRDKGMQESSDVSHANTLKNEPEISIPPHPDIEELFEKEKRTVLVLQKQKEAISKDLSYFSQIVDELTAQNTFLEKKLESEISKSRCKDEDLSFLLDKIRAVNNKARDMENISKKAKAELEIAQKKASADQEKLLIELQERNSTIELLKTCLNDALKQVEMLTTKESTKYHKREPSRKYSPDYTSLF